MRLAGAIPRWKWILLVTELVLFAVILVLPQVNLPDFTFHGGSAPVVAKTRISHVPAQLAVTSHSGVLVLGRAFIAVKISAAQLPSKEHDLRLSLLCTLIC
jgi:hypothetical protein